MVAKESKAPKKRKKACPKCGSVDVVPILYGYPMPETFEAAKRGEIALGGCCVTDDDPRRLCKACGAEFDRPKAHAPRLAGGSRKRTKRPAG